MNLGIVHLSDIHLRKGELDSTIDDSIARSIAAAVRTELIGTTHLLLIISGDISYGGDEEEYTYATDWLCALYTYISDSCDATCWIICCPGNHDIDHSANRRLRSALIDKVRQEPTLSSERDIIGNYPGLIGPSVCM